MLKNARLYLDLDKNTSLLKACFAQIKIYAAIIIFLLQSSMVHADGLFDFQMKLAKMGNAVAEFKVGEMYETGFGVKKDLKEAQAWTEKAASHGDQTAGFKLLYWDIEKNGLNAKNKKKFAELRIKADEENAQAMYFIGKMYAHGVGMKKNYDKSLDWLNKATYVGVLQAETEATHVRGMKQSALQESRKAEEQRKAEDKRKAMEMAEAQRKAEQEKQLKIIVEKKKEEDSPKKEKAGAAKSLSAKQKVEELAKALAKAKAEVAAQAKTKKADVKAIRADANAKIEARAQADAELGAYE